MAEERNHEGQPDGGLGGRHGDNEEHDDLAVHGALGRPKAMNARLTAFSITSIDRSIVITLRRRKTPIVPVANRMADRMR